MIKVIFESDDSIVTLWLPSATQDLVPCLINIVGTTLHV